MLGLVFLLTVAAIAAVALVALPSDVRELLAENCRGRKGQIKFKYVLREANALAEFYAGFLFFGAIVAVLICVAALAVDEYLIPIDLAKSAMKNVSLDPATTKTNLIASGIPTDHENWVRANGGSVAEAQTLQYLLWYGFPIALVLSFASIAFSMRFMSSHYDKALEELVKGGVNRDRARLTHHYLRDTQHARRRLSSEEFHVNVDSASQVTDADENDEPAKVAEVCHSSGDDG